MPDLKARLRNPAAEVGVAAAAAVAVMDRAAPLVGRALRQPLASKAERRVFQPARRKGARVARRRKIVPVLRVSPIR